MNYYKEIALAAQSRNGKKYAKGDVIRERVPLDEVHLKTLTKTPEITNCSYELIVEEVDDKPLRKELFDEARTLVADGKLKKMPAFSTKTDALEELIKNAK